MIRILKSYIHKCICSEFEITKCFHKFKILDKICDIYLYENI